MIDVRCPSCKKWLKVDEQYRGTTGKCVQCGCPVTVPKKGIVGYVAIGGVAVLAGLSVLGSIVGPPPQQRRTVVEAAPPQPALVAPPTQARTFTDSDVQKIEADVKSRLEKNTITLAKFNQLGEGMSYRQVAQILGSEGTIISENAFGQGRYRIHTVMYSWDAGFMASMNCMFQNDRLMSRSQFGLR